MIDAERFWNVYLLNILIRVSLGEIHENERQEDLPVVQVRAWPLQSMLRKPDGGRIQAEGRGA